MHLSDKFSLARLSKCFMIAMIAGTTASCVIEPIDQTHIASKSTPVDVVGFASAPNATMRIDALNVQTSTWQQIAMAQSSATPTNNNGTLLYLFSRDNLTIPAQYWKPGQCGTPHKARLRVREDGGSLSPLATFDQAAHDCLFDEIGEGTPWFDAGLSCFSGREMELFVGTPPC